MLVILSIAMLSQQLVSTGWAAQEEKPKVFDQLWWGHFLKDCERCDADVLRLGVDPYCLG